jgi:hypothetical protein
MQGTAGVVAQPCGTVGLGTCVGVAYPRADGQWFIAHIDCAARVTSRRDPMYGRVSNYVSARMRELRGNFVGGVLELSSTGHDFSTFAITDGLRAWAGAQVPIRGWDGFRIANGVFGQAPPGTVNDTHGNAPFSVPAQP